MDKIKEKILFEEKLKELFIEYYAGADDRIIEKEAGWLKRNILKIHKEALTTVEEEMGGWIKIELNAWAWDAKHSGQIKAIFQAIDNYLGKEE